VTTHLAHFQDAFVAALHDGGDFPLARQPGFRVYRNTVARACVDALQANFPAVGRLVGEEWLRQVAALYARRHPPVQRSLLHYGEDFPGFLADLAAASDLPYLPGVAQLDANWLQAHVAADEPALAAADVAGLPAHRLGQLRLRPHASARWAWFPGIPVYTIWDASRRGSEVPQPLHWQDEGALLVRRADEVCWLPLDRAGCRLLDACRAGHSLAEAAAGCDSGAAGLAPLFARLLGAGAFARQTATSEEEWQ
jgi:hypothetical protein